MKFKVCRCEVTGLAKLGEIEISFQYYVPQESLAQNRRPLPWQLQILMVDLVYHCILLLLLGNDSECSQSNDSQALGNGTQLHARRGGSGGWGGGLATGHCEE